MALVPSQNPQYEMFNVEKQSTIDGVEMGMLENGVPFLTESGLARMCGIDRKVLNNMFDYFSSLCNEIEQGSLPSQYSVSEMQKLIQHAHKMRVDKAYQASINQFDELYRRLATA